MIVYTVKMAFYNPKENVYLHTSEMICRVFASYDSAVKYVEDDGADKISEDPDDEYMWVGRKDEKENFGVEYIIQSFELLA